MHCMHEVCPEDVSVENQYCNSGNLTLFSELEYKSYAVLCMDCTLILCFCLGHSLVFQHAIGKFIQNSKVYTRLTELLCHYEWSPTPCFQCQYIGLET